MHYDRMMPDSASKSLELYASLKCISSTALHGKPINLGRRLDSVSAMAGFDPDVPAGGILDMAPYTNLELLSTVEWSEVAIFKTGNHLAIVEPGSESREHQDQGERTMDQQMVVSLVSTAVLAIQVDEMRVECQRREAEQE